MNINRYGRTYRNGILVAKFRVSYVKITSTLPKGILGDPHLTHTVITSTVPCTGLRVSDQQN